MNGACVDWQTGANSTVFGELKETSYLWIPVGVESKEDTLAIAVQVCNKCH